MILPIAVLRYSINITIRQAQIADAPVVADLNLRLARETEDLHLDPDTVIQGVAAVLRDESKGLYYVAEVDGTIAGQVMITYEWSDWRNGNLWWLQSVYVKHEFRQVGIFRALFSHLQTMARQTPEVRGLRLYMHSKTSGHENATKALG